MANSAIGIDFGHSYIKLVELRRRGRQVVIQRASLLPIPQGSLHNGAPAEGNSITDVLAEVSPGLRMDRAAIVAGITGSEVTVRNLTISDVLDNELTPAVMQELAILLRLAPEELEGYIFDYHALPSVKPMQHDVIAVGMERQVALSYTAMLRQAHLAPHVLDMEAFALPRALPVDGRMCYIEIGAENTQVYVTSDSEYLLYRLVPVGTARLAGAIASSYNITVAEATALQQRTHIDTIVSEAPGDKSQLRRVLEEITGGLIQTLEFLRARQRISSITELLPSAVLCGGGALQNGMSQLLGEETGLPVDVAHPFTGRPGADGLPANLLMLEPLFTGALGLALRGIDDI